MNRISIISDNGYYYDFNHYLNQSWVIVNWTPRKQLQGKFDQKTKFVHEKAFDTIVYGMAVILSKGRWTIKNPFILHSQHHGHWRLTNAKSGRPRSPSIIQVCPEWSAASFNREYALNQRSLIINVSCVLVICDLSMIWAFQAIEYYSCSEFFFTICPITKYVPTISILLTNGATGECILSSNLIIFKVAHEIICQSITHNNIDVRKA